MERAATPEIARDLYLRDTEFISRRAIHTHQGIFAADLKV